MEGIFIGVLCLSGCLTFSTCLVHQYHFVSDAKNWTEAQSYCREKYTDLATIENTEEMKKLNDTVSAAGHSSEVWIGLYSHIDWKWSDGFNQSGAEYSRLFSDNVEGKEFWTVHSKYGVWHDVDNHRTSPFVCYQGTLEESNFVLHHDLKNWSEAQRYCREHYTDLATVRNDTVNNMITSLISPLEWASIGLYRDPQIYWSDGSAYLFSSWYNGVTLLGSMKVVCGVADLEKGGNWRLRSCEERKPFVCYSIPTSVKTVVKMRVKLEDSSMDLNNAAVKEQILKKLQDRLKENGLSGVTLKWKKQADGKVFHEEEKGCDKKKKTEL